MPADKTVNWEGGSDARYNTGQMWQQSPGVLTDGVYQYDTEGRPLSAIPNEQEWTPGLPGARGGTGPGGGGGGGGSADGLAGLAINSPWYQQALAASQAAEAADAASRKAAIQQMLVQFGLVPGGFQDPYGDVDQTTRDLAAANTASGISASARLLQALKDAQKSSVSQLTARGLRRSGARGYEMRRNQLGYDQSYSDAVQKLLGSAQSLYSGFAQNQYNRQMSLANALASAVSNMSSFTPTSYNRVAVAAPAPVSAPAYWASKPAPTYTNPATGTNWYGGTSGLESTRFPGKAADSSY